MLKSWICYLKLFQHPVVSDLPLQPSVLFLSTPAGVRGFDSEATEHTPLCLKQSRLLCLFWKHINFGPNYVRIFRRWPLELIYSLLIYSKCMMFGCSFYSMYPDTFWNQAVLIVKMPQQATFYNTLNQQTRRSLIRKQEDGKLCVKAPNCDDFLKINLEKKKD